MASKPQKFFSARPRRFGKSLLISTLESLFKNGIEYFKGLDSEILWDDNKKYNVIRLDFFEIKNFSNLDGLKGNLFHYWSETLRELDSSTGSALFIQFLPKFLIGFRMSKKIPLYY